jgi:hypothetical protein
LLDCSDFAAAETCLSEMIQSLFFTSIGILPCHWLYGVGNYLLLFFWVCSTSYYGSAGDAHHSCLVADTNIMVTFYIGAVRRGNSLWLININTPDV